MNSVKSEKINWIKRKQNIFSKSEYTEQDDEMPEHKNLLERVLNKITTHKHRGTIDQTSYYDTLRKVSARK